MAVRLLLDEHVPTPLAPRLRARGIDAVSLQEWQHGAYLSSPDEEILRAAGPELRTLVTYDVGTVPDVAVLLVQSGIEHAGVVLISEKTIRQDDVGTLIRALERLAKRYDEMDLTNQILFLSRAP